MCACAQGPVRVNLSVFLSEPRLVFISPAAPTVFPSPSPGAQDNFPPCCQASGITTHQVFLSLLPRQTETELRTCANKRVRRGGRGGEGRQTDGKGEVHGG